MNKTIFENLKNEILKIETDAIEEYRKMFVGKYLVLFDFWDDNKGQSYKFCGKVLSVYLQHDHFMSSSSITYSLIAYCNRYDGDFDNVNIGLDRFMIVDREDQCIKLFNTYEEARLFVELNK